MVFSDQQERQAKGYQFKAEVYGLIRLSAEAVRQLCQRDKALPQLTVNEELNPEPWTLNSEPCIILIFSL